MRKRTIVIWMIALVLVAAGLLVATSLGAKTLSLSEIWNAIFHYNSSLEDMLVRDSRLPRALCSVIIGGILAVAGAIMQGITRNALAEPSIMGMTQGATLAVAISSVNLSVYGLLGNGIAAFIGATFSGFLVLLFSMKNTRNMSLARLLIAGTAISTFFLSMASVIAMVGNRSQDLAFWLSGGLRNVTWEHFFLLLVVGSVCIFLSILLAPQINIISVGDDAAIGLGVNPVKFRILSVLLIIPMCAVSVAVAGNIAFVGLIIPHVVRKLIGIDVRKIIPLSFVCGGALLLWADIAAKMVLIPYETPVGLFTAVLGIPIFITLVRRERT